MSWLCFLLWHRWRPQAVEQVSVYGNIQERDAGFPESLETRVLYRCIRCPRHRVRTLQGHWTLEQLVLGEEMHDSPQSKVRT